MRHRAALGRLARRRTIARRTRGRWRCGQGSPCRRSYRGEQVLRAAARLRRLPSTPTRGSTKKLPRARQTVGGSSCRSDCNSMGLRCRAVSSLAACNIIRLSASARRLVPAKRPSPAPPCPLTRRTLFAAGSMAVALAACQVSHPQAQPPPALAPHQQAHPPQPNQWPSRPQPRCWQSASIARCCYMLAKSARSRRLARVRAMDMARPRFRRCRRPLRLESSRGCPCRRSSRLRKTRSF